MTAADPLNRQRLCSAPGCVGLRSTTYGLLCADHEYKWTHEGWRLTAGNAANEAAKAASIRKVKGGTSLYDWCGTSRQMPDEDWDRAKQLAANVQRMYGDRKVSS